MWRHTIINNSVTTLVVAVVVSIVVQACNSLTIVLVTEAATLDVAIVSDVVAAAIVSANAVRVVVECYNRYWQ